MDEYARAAVEAAVAAGARYADARVMISKTESMSAQNAVVERLAQDESAGLGVRALVGSSWGFFATPTLTMASAGDTGRRAVDIARASGIVAGPTLSLADAGGGGPKVASWSSACDEDPLSVPLSEKGDLLVAITAAMHDAGVQIGQASYSNWDTRKRIVSREGH
jgi:TldD protein